MSKKSLKPEDAGGKAKSLPENYDGDISMSKKSLKPEDAGEKVKPLPENYDGSMPQSPMWEPCWTIQVELIHPVNYGDSYKQSFLRYHIPHPDEVKYDGDVLYFIAVPGGFAHAVPACNIVKWEIHHTNVPPLEGTDVPYQFVPYPVPMGTRGTFYVGYYERQDGICLAFLGKDRQITYRTQYE